jgi:hypothetical protein
MRDIKNHSNLKNLSQEWEVKKERVLRRLDRKIIPLERVILDAAEHGIQPSEKILAKYSRLYRRWEKVIRMEVQNGRR